MMGQLNEHGLCLQTDVISILAPQGGPDPLLNLPWPHQEMRIPTKRLPRGLFPVSSRYSIIWGCG